MKTARFNDSDHETPLTLLAGSQVKDRCPLGYLFRIGDENRLKAAHSVMKFY